MTLSDVPHRRLGMTDQGEAFAQTNLGLMYNTGQRVPQDYVCVAIACGRVILGSSPRTRARPW